MPWFLFLRTGFSTDQRSSRTTLIGLFWLLTRLPFVDGRRQKGKRVFLTASETPNCRQHGRQSHHLTDPLMRSGLAFLQCQDRAIRRVCACQAAFRQDDTGDHIIIAITRAFS